MTLESVKRSVKDQLRRLDRIYARTFHEFDANELRTVLRNLELTPGETVCVHSAFAAFRGFTGKPTDVLRLLDEVIGPEGTLLMPSMPFTGSAIKYVRSGAVTDIARAPARTGLLPELFRRQKGTLRSVHPTHPILARGAGAEAIIAGHIDAQSPCGAGSPFAKLLQRNGKILFLGVDIRSMTFFHHLEERFEGQLFPSPLTRDLYEASVRAEGKTLTIKTRLYEPALSRRRHVAVMLPELRRLGGIATTRIGLLPLMVVRAEAARDAFEAVLKAGKTFYDRR
jgi:aminoglycoside 3-N-acetyltransferase